MVDRSSSVRTVCGCTRPEASTVDGERDEADLSPESDACSTAEEPMVCTTLRWREVVWTPSAGQGRFWLGTVMSVAGLSASRGSHLDFALDAHSLTAGLPG